MALVCSSFTIQLSVKDMMENESSRAAGTQENPIVSPLQILKPVAEWTIYEVRAFLLKCKYNTVIRETVKRVGLTGRALLLIISDSEVYYWDKLLNETTSENQYQKELCKLEILAVETTAAQWRIEQNNFSMKYFGDRLIFNNYYDDGVSFKSMLILLFNLQVDGVIFPVFFL